MVLLDGLNSVFSSDQQYISLAVGKNTYGNNAHPVVDLFFPLSGIGNVHTFYIDDSVAVVSGEVTVNRFKAEILEFSEN